MLSVGGWLWPKSKGLSLPQNKGVFPSVGWGGTAILPSARERAKFEETLHKAPKVANRVFKSLSKIFLKPLEPPVAKVEVKIEKKEVDLKQDIKCLLVEAYKAKERLPIFFMKVLYKLSCSAEARELMAHAKEAINLLNYVLEEPSLRTKLLEIYDAQVKRSSMRQTVEFFVDDYLKGVYVEYVQGLAKKEDPEEQVKALCKKHALTYEPISRDIRSGCWHKVLETIYHRFKA
ncbi:MAG: hypothetical protein FJZ63_06695 [Chlamydiae bacterium]|nr:hypothetical protein [Chlamydiota bacterium]